MKDSWKVIAILVCVLFVISLVWQYFAVNSTQQKLTDLQARSAPLLEAYEAQMKANEPAPAPNPEDVKAGDSFFTGAAEAKTTLIVFTDFQCPYCAKMHESIDAARKKFSSSDLKIVYRNFPLSGHPQALPAAKAVMAAGKQGKFIEMADLLFKNQTALADDKYVEWAKQLKLNVSKFQEDMKSAAVEEAINKEKADGESYGVTGTPAAFLDGVQIGGALEANALEAKIREKL